MGKAGSLCKETLPLDWFRLPCWAEGQPGDWWLHVIVGTLPTPSVSCEPGHHPIGPLKALLIWAQHLVWTQPVCLDNPSKEFSVLWELSQLLLLLLFQRGRQGFRVSVPGPCLDGLHPSDNHTSFPVLQTEVQLLYQKSCRGEGIFWHNKTFRRNVQAFPHFFSLPTRKGDMSLGGAAD